MNVCNRQSCQFSPPFLLGWGRGAAQSVWVSHCPPWVAFAMLATSHHNSCCSPILTSSFTFPLIPLLSQPLCILLTQAQKHCIHVKGQIGIQGRWDAGLLDLSSQHCSICQHHIWRWCWELFNKARSEVSQHKASKRWSQKTGTHWSSFQLSGMKSVKHQKATPQVSFYIFQKKQSHQTGTGADMTVPGLWHSLLLRTVLSSSTPALCCGTDLEGI